MILKNYSDNKWLMNEYEIINRIKEYMECTISAIKDYQFSYDCEKFVEYSSEEINNLLLFINNLREELDEMKFKDKDNEDLEKSKYCIIGFNENNELDEIKLEDKDKNEKFSYKGWL